MLHKDKVVGLTLHSKEQTPGCWQVVGVTRWVEIPHYDEKHPRLETQKVAGVVRTSPDI